MNEAVLKFLKESSGAIIKDLELLPFFQTKDQRYSFVKRLLQKGHLLSLKRGVYYNALRLSSSLPDLMLIAGLLNGPSFVSFETALVLHGWIPEANTIVQSACCKKSRRYSTALGVFQYVKIPSNHFYLSVELKTNGFIASPWRSIADLIYVKKRNWTSMQDLQEDLRINPEFLEDLRLDALAELSKFYPSTRTRQSLAAILRSLT